jgi:succinate-acetate transporter protein
MSNNLAAKLSNPALLNAGLYHCSIELAQHCLFKLDITIWATGIAYRGRQIIVGLMESRRAKHLRHRGFTSYEHFWRSLC